MLSTRMSTRETRTNIMDDNFLSDSTQRAIMNGNFEEAGQYLVRHSLSESDYNESASVVGQYPPDRSSDSNWERIAELERKLAAANSEKAALRENNADLIVQNTRLAKKCNDIRWYKWLGEWTTKILARTAALCSMDGMQALLTNESFIKLAAKSLSTIYELPLAGAIIAGCGIVYWLCSADNKKLKAKAFISGVQRELSKLPSSMEENMSSLFKLLQRVMSEHSSVLHSIQAS